MYVGEGFDHVALSGSHVAKPGHAELDTERTSERRKGDAERNHEIHHSQHPVSKCLQKQATSMNIAFLFSELGYSKSHVSFQGLPRHRPLVLLIRLVLS